MIFGEFKMKEPQKILGGHYVDDRGFLKALIFPEGFTPKRLYSVNNWRVNFIRARHGHQFESKLIYMAFVKRLQSYASMSVKHM
jgi:hypothetical protein